MGISKTGTTTGVDMNKVSVYGGVVHTPGATNGPTSTGCRPTGHNGRNGFTEFRLTSAAVTCRRCLKIVRDRDHVTALEMDAARAEAAKLNNCPLCARAQESIGVCADCTSSPSFNDEIEAAIIAARGWRNTLPCTCGSAYGGNWPCHCR